MAWMDGAYLYILRCADGSFYVGTTRKHLEERVAEHNTGVLGGYTATRRPVTLVFAEQFERIADAIAAERQVKGWSRSKKEALAGGDWATIQRLSERRKPFATRATPFFETPASRAPQDEVD
jgi:putative endonuclease